MVVLSPITTIKDRAPLLREPNDLGIITVTFEPGWRDGSERVAGNLVAGAPVSARSQATASRDIRKTPGSLRVACASQISFHDQIFPDAANRDMAQCQCLGQALRATVADHTLGILPSHKSRSEIEHDVIDEFCA